MSTPYVMITVSDVGVDMPDVDRTLLRAAVKQLNWSISNEPIGLVNCRGMTLRVQARKLLRIELERVIGAQGNQ